MGQPELTPPPESGASEKTPETKPVGTATKPSPGADPWDTGAGHMLMSEELDKPKWTLPPILPVVIALVAVAVVIAIFVAGTSSPKTAGKILAVYAADIPGANRTMVTIQLSVENRDKKPLWIQDVRAQLKPAGQKPGDATLEDTAASASDLNRYLQAFPDLAAHKSDPFPLDQKIQPGGSVEGMVLVAFPVAKDAFDKRQSLKVIVQPYDHEALTLKQ